jgi:hypothetical protein
MPVFKPYLENDVKTLIFLKIHLLRQALYKSIRSVVYTQKNKFTGKRHGLSPDNIKRHFA